MDETVGEHRAWPDGRQVGLWGLLGPEDRANIQLLSRMLWLMVGRGRRAEQPVAPWPL